MCILITKKKYYFLYLLILIVSSGCHQVIVKNNFQQVIWGPKTPIPIYPINSLTTEINNQFYNTKKLITDNIAKKLTTPYQYKMKPGDQINIIIWGHPNLNNPNNAAIANTPGAIFTVDDNGDIYYPFIGKVHFSGLSISNARALLKGKISKFIKNPSVNLSVVKFANAHVNVLGAVNKPKWLALTEVPLSLADAIGQSEGVTELGDLRNVVLKRNKETYKIDLLEKNNTINSQIILQPDDLVYVSQYSETRVFVVGEVFEPRVVWLQDDRLNITEALAASQWLNIPRAKKDIYVLRLEKDHQPAAYKLNISKPAGILLGSQFKLRPNDVVYVGTNDLAVWNDIVSQLLTTALVLENSTRSVSNSTRAIRDIQAIQQGF